MVKSSTTLKIRAAGHIHIHPYFLSEYSFLEIQPFNQAKGTDGK